MKDKLMRALKKNRHFQSLTVVFKRGFFHCGVDFVTGPSQERLDFLVHRNQLFKNWLRDPYSVPTHLWYEVLAMAAKFGINHGFDALHVVGRELTRSFSSDRLLIHHVRAANVRREDTTVALGGSVRLDDATVALAARALEEAALRRTARACLQFEMEDKIIWYESQIALIRSQIESLNVNQN